MISGVLPNVGRRLQAVLDEMKKRGHPMKITSTYRSWKAQDALYAQGRTKPGAKVTNAVGGQSYHNYKVAADFCFVSATPYEGPWQMFGEVGESFGLEWGGRWKSFPDRPHLQMTYGQSIGTLKSMGEVRAISMLERLDAEKPLGTPEKPIETKRSEWEENAISWAKQKGIAVMWHDPDQIVTIPDAAQMFFNAGLLKQLPVDKDNNVRGMRKVELAEMLRKLLS